MNHLVLVLACLAPMAIYALAIGLRAVAEMQPENVMYGNRRQILYVVSYVLVGVAFLSVVLTILVNGGVTVIMLLLFGLATIQMFGLEYKIAQRRRISQQAELLWLMATTIRSGGNLPNELQLYAEGAWGERRERLLDLADRMREGTPLSEITVPQGLLPHSATLEMQTALGSGRLAEALRTLAIRLTREMVDTPLAFKTKTGMHYPVVILTATILIVGFIMYYIIPKFKKIFDDFGTELPDITKVLIGQSDAVVNFWYLTVPFVSPIVAVILIMEYGDAVGWRLASQRLLGGFVARVYTPDLLRALSHAVAARQNLDVTIEGILYSSAASGLKSRLKSVLLELEQGMPFWNGLGRRGFLRGSEVALLESAETAGNLDWTLNAIADAIERRWSYRMYALMETYSPVIVLIPGFVVGFVVIALFMPLIKLLYDLS